MSNPVSRLVLGSLLSVLLTFSAGSQAQVTLTFGGSDTIGSVLDRTNAMFTKLVNERAAGKLKVNFIQGEQLGNDVQVIEQMMKGSVHIYGDVLDWYSNWVKDFSILAWGFTFLDFRDPHFHVIQIVRAVDRLLGEQNPWLRRCRCQYSQPVFGSQLFGQPGKRR